MAGSYLVIIENGENEKVTEKELKEFMRKNDYLDKREVISACIEYGTTLKMLDGRRFWIDKKLGTKKKGEKE